MRERVYIDRLFANHDDTPGLRDFKEEIAANLSERVREFVAKGLNEDEAFDRATAELGDITAVADDAAMRKRTETIGQMYMKSKVPVSKSAAAGFTGATAFLLAAAGLGLMSFFGQAGEARYYISAVLLAIACALYAYFGLSRETTAHYAMKRGRALVYGAIALMGVLGAGLAAVSFLIAGWRLSDTIGVKAALILPAVCGLVFMLSTEPKRQKPWLKAMVDRSTDTSLKSHIGMIEPLRAARYGVASGALWLLAVALCLTLGVFAGWKYSWLPPLFALPVQLLMTLGIFKKSAE